MTSPWSQAGQQQSQNSKGSSEPTSSVIKFYHLSNIYIWKIFSFLVHAQVSLNRQLHNLQYFPSFSIFLFIVFSADIITEISRKMFNSSGGTKHPYLFSSLMGSYLLIGFIENQCWVLANAIFVSVAIITFFSTHFVWLNCTLGSSYWAILAFLE